MTARAPVHLQYHVHGSQDFHLLFAWHFEPCDELGGDILNVLPCSDRYVVMYLLDVAGHGVPAALLSVTLSRVLTARESSSSFILAETTAGAHPGIRARSRAASSDARDT